VAKENKTTLPSAGLFIIRYHSFYGKYKYIYIERERERERERIDIN
jgi:inositol oxygenase